VTTKTDIGEDFWLDASAAASFKRCLATGAPFAVESAGRSWAYQAYLWSRYGRPRAVPPGESFHVKGQAIDADPALRNWFLAHPDFGWVRTTWEDWHFQYFPERDTRARPAPLPKPVEKPTTIEEEDIMYTLVSFGDSSEMGLWNPRTNSYVKLQTMTGVGYCRAALPLREAKYATKAEFDAWRTTLAPILKG